MPEISELIQKGKHHLEHQNYPEALSCFEQALLLEQNNPDVMNLTGTALRSMGRYEEAVEYFNKSLEIDPRDKNSS